MDTAQTVPVLVLDDQAPGGHHLIHPQDDLMDHEMEGEDLPPPEPKQTYGQTAKSKAVKKAQTKETYAKPEPKPKVEFYDDEPFEEEPPEEEPSGSRDLPRERSRPGQRDRSRSPIPET